MHSGVFSRMLVAVLAGFAVCYAIYMAVRFFSPDYQTETAFSYVIANNQNSVMWRLTIITVIIEIPNIIFAFYGINTDTLPFKSSWVYAVLITAILTTITAYILLRKRKF